MKHSQIGAYTKQLRTSDIDIALEQTLDYKSWGGKESIRFMSETPGARLRPMNKAILKY